MSFHFDLVIICELQEDTPTSCIDLISWLSDVNSQSTAKPNFDCFDEGNQELGNVFDYPFLASLPEEEVISMFQKKYRYTKSANAGGQDVYRYCLQYSARNLLDDDFFQCHLLFLDWLASFIENGFIGYYKEALDANPHLLYVKDRKLIYQ